MRLLLIGAVAAAVILPTSASSQEGWGQIVLNNQSSSTATLYVDGGFGCGPVFSGNFCPTQVRVGIHSLEARLADGRQVSQGGVPVGQGEVQTWTISEQ